MTAAETTTPVASDAGFENGSSRMRGAGWFAVWSDLTGETVFAWLARHRCRNNRRRSAGSLPRSETLERRWFLTGGLTVTALGDLNAATDSITYVRDIAVSGSHAFFVGSQRAEGEELWVTDGTTAGTRLLKDIQAGLDSSVISEPTNVSGKLYFSAEDVSHGKELWVSDGTAVGTTLVRDIYPGTGGSDPQYLVNVSGTLYFQATDESGTQLWRSDGTAAGTKVVKAFDWPTWPTRITNVNGVLYFSADHPDTGAELWKSDGTSAGTVLVRDILPGADSGRPLSLTNVNGVLYFRANDGTSGHELWKSNGTAAGTVRIKDIAPGPANSSPNWTDPPLLTIGATTWFYANDGTSGAELWKTDGSTAGTVLVRDILPGPGGSAPYRYDNLINLNGTLFFSANDGQTGFELWKSDGTTAGTVQVRDISPGILSGIYAGQDPLVNVSGTLFFAADDGETGTELWKSNGTTAGTALVADLHPGPKRSLPYHLTNYSGTLLFSVYDESTGYQVWKSNGTEAGTTQISNLINATADGHLAEMTNLAGTLIFRSSVNHSVYGEVVEGNELWRSDGTSAGTILLSDPAPNASFFPAYLTVAGDSVFFVASDDDVTGRELWKTDGTKAGTQLVKDITPGLISSEIRSLANYNGTLMFSAKNPLNSIGSELWRSDGTAAGTVLVRDIEPSPYGEGDPYGLTQAGGTLFFRATSSNDDHELWRTDGTTAGTIRVKDIYPGTTNSSVPYNFVSVGGSVFFNANDGTTGREVWKSDGTAAGTLLVRDTNPYGDGLFETPVNVSGTVYFGGYDEEHFFEVWKSDGTAAGTVLVKDIQPGTEFAERSSYPEHLTNVNGTLYFTADDGISGRELWMSNGTAAGTVMVKDVRPGIGTSAPKYLTNVNGKLYFIANDGVNGERIWSSDGTAAGTVSYGLGNGQPNVFATGPLVAVGDKVFFGAVSNEHGQELFVLQEVAAPTTAPTINQPTSPTAAQRPLISWSAVDGATEYEVWIKNQSTNTNPFHTATVADTSYVPPIDLGIGRFNLWVRAKNSGGNGPWSSQYNFTINTRPTVSDPGRYLDTNKPTLNWTALPGAVKYDLWIDDKLGGVSQFIRDQNVATNSWTPATDMPLGLYHAWVRGIAADGTGGSWSVTTIFYVMPAPNVTQGINPTFDRTPDFAWDPLLGAVKYEVFIRNRVDGTTTLYQQNIAATNFSPPTALEDGPYRVWVLGVSAANVRSFWTNLIDIRVGGPTEILTPTGTTGDTTPTFTWQTMDGADHYDLWVDQIGGTTQVIREQNLIGTVYTPTTPLPLGSYRVWVRAISTTGEVCPWSVTVEFTIAGTSAVDQPRFDAETFADAAMLTGLRLIDGQRPDQDDPGSASATGGHPSEDAALPPFERPTADRYAGATRRPGGFPPETAGMFAPDGPTVARFSVPVSESEVLDIDGSRMIDAALIWWSERAIEQF